MNIEMCIDVEVGIDIDTGVGHQDGSGNAVCDSIPTEDDHGANRHHPGPVDRTRGGGGGGSSSSSATSGSVRSQASASRSGGGDGGTGAVPGTAHLPETTNHVAPDAAARGPPRRNEAIAGWYNLIFLLVAALGFTFSVVLSLFLATTVFRDSPLSPSELLLVCLAGTSIAITAGIEFLFARGVIDRGAADELVEQTRRVLSFFPFFPLAPRSYGPPGGGGGDGSTAAAVVDV